MISGQGRRVIFQLSTVNKYPLRRFDRKLSLYLRTPFLPYFEPLIFNVLQSNSMDAITGLSNYITYYQHRPS